MIRTLFQQLHSAKLLQSHQFAPRIELAIGRKLSKDVRWSRRPFATKPQNDIFPPRQASFLQQGDSPIAKHLMDRLTELDKRLQYQGWHTLRWTLLVLAVGSGVAWLFRDNVSSGVGDAASEVTRRTLENQDVQQQASTLARGVVYELLNDKRALDLASQFVNEVIQRESTKLAILGVMQDVLSRKETEESLRNLVANVLTHPDSASKAVEFLQHVVAIPESRDALVTVLTAVLAQPASQKVTSEFFTGVMGGEAFIAASNKLGWDTVNYLFGNEELRQTAVTWCNSVLNDPALQNTAGEAVWNAVKGAFVPWGKSKHHTPALSPPPVTPHNAPASTPPPAPQTATVIITQAPVDAVALVQGDKVSIVAPIEENESDIERPHNKPVVQENPA